MPNLFPTDYEKEIIEPSDIEGNTPIGYKNGIAFDYAKGDFSRDGKNKVLDATGIESWKAWCINCLQTERYKHIAYSSDFGIELDPIWKATSREEAESLLTRQITEAILADPYGRADYIESIEFEWDASDAIKVDLIIHGIDDVSIDITAYLTRGNV